MAQLTAWSLSIQEDPGLKPVIGNFYRTYLLLTVCRKDENKEREVGNDPFFKSRRMSIKLAKNISQEKWKILAILQKLPKIRAIWAKQAFKSCPKCNKSLNLVTLIMKDEWVTYFLGKLKDRSRSLFKIKSSKLFVQKLLMANVEIYAHYTLKCFFIAIYWLNVANILST